MNRAFLMALLALDLLVLGASGYMVWERVQHAMRPRPLESALPAPAVQSLTPAPTTQAESQIASEPATGKPPSAKAEPAQTPKSRATSQKPVKPKKISFHYHDALADRVSVAGDFNQWSPQPMKKDSKGRWQALFLLKPGEYAYNFIVDGKMIRDPAAKKTKKAGQKIPSSLLLVK